MIKETITYKNQLILTIFHENFPDESRMPERLIRRKIGRYLAVFRERIVEAAEWDALDGYMQEESVLCLPKQKYNPYGDSACAYMRHRVFAEKPAVLIREGRLLPQPDDTEQLLAFVKEYTGMDLSEYPIFFGDAFLFSPTEISCRTNEKDSVIVLEPKAGMRITVCFRKRSDIVSVKTVEIPRDMEQIEITSEDAWDSHDIEIHKDEKIIYRNTDMHYVKSIRLNAEFRGRQRKIPLRKQSDYVYHEKAGSQESVIGTSTEHPEDILRRMNAAMVRELKNAKASGRMTFFGPGEQERAHSMLRKEIFAESDELWLIDSYFSDFSRGNAQIIDWLRLLVNAGAQTRHVIFYCRQDSTHAYPAADVKRLAQKDPVIGASMKQNGQKIELLQTKESIHDRFLLTRTGEEYRGLLIGTSLNSLDHNFYTIGRLEQAEAKTVARMLLDWLPEHTQAREVCGNDAE